MDSCSDHFYSILQNLKKEKLAIKWYKLSYSKEKINNNPSNNFNFLKICVFKTLKTKNNSTEKLSFWNYYELLEAVRTSC